MKNIPLYKYPFSYAVEHNELEQYRLSNTANSRCRDAIEAAIRSNYRDNRLNEAGAEKIISDFGAERTMYVLANTLHHADWDSRYSPTNKTWAETVLKRVHSEKNYIGDPTLRYLISSHPGLVNIFVDQVRRLTEAA